MLFGTKARQLSRAERRAMVERMNPALPISQQCRLLALPRSSVYRKSAEVSAEDLAIMGLIDRHYLARPYYGSRRIAAWLATQGHRVNRKRHGVTISMDGKGRCMDNIFVERLWRSLKYEEVYLHAYATVAEAKAGIGAWLDFYNTERQHQGLGYRTPRQVYQEGLWVCGRSALPTGCASPASRANSESGEMLAFAHIPTGATINKPIELML